VQGSNRIRLSAAAFQPVSSADVAAALAKIAVQSPRNQMAEVTGLDKQPIVWFINAYLEHKDDPREVIADTTATYFGAPIDDQSLTPGANPISVRTTARHGSSALPQRPSQQAGISCVPDISDEESHMQIHHLFALLPLLFSGLVMAQDKAATAGSIR